jgi:hypothetical protein
MDEQRRIYALKCMTRAARDQLRRAIIDRDAAWLALARIATAERLKAADLRRLARQACPGDPWNTRIDLELRQNGSLTSDR